MKQFTRRSMLRCSGMAAASLALQTRGIAWAQSALLAPPATTTAGKVSGVLVDGVNVFNGIPYGGDTAKTRFKAPAPTTPWKGVKECTRFAAMAPQLMIARAPSGVAPRLARD
jgi:para-nitrobenzyl esterase